MQICNKTPHAELMLQYALDAQTHAEPWLLWEVYDESRNTWVGFKCSHPLWYSGIKHRRKPQTININGFEIPAPASVYLNVGDRYYVPDLCPTYSKQLPWSNDTIDHFYFSSGLVHSTEEAAMKHAEALRSFTNG